MSAKKPGNSSPTSAKKRTVIRGQSKVKKLPVDAVLSDGDEIASSVKPRGVKKIAKLNGSSLGPQLLVVQVQLVGPPTGLLLLLMIFLLSD